MHLTATVSPRSTYSARSTSPKAPLPRRRGWVRWAWGTRASPTVAAWVASGALATLAGVPRNSAGEGAGTGEAGAREAGAGEAGAGGEGGAAGAASLEK